MELSSLCGTSTAPRQQSCGNAATRDDGTRTHGFTPAASLPSPNVGRWADKDLLLNVMGYHHLHFDAAPSNQMRSDDVLFVHVTRDTLTVLGIFNHTVFEATQANAAMTPERDRLWKIFDERSTRGAPPGAVVVRTMVATSGHNLYFTKVSMDYARVIANQDPKLDDADYVRSLYEEAGVPVPARPKIKWRLQFLDLGLFDDRARVFFALRKGPI